MLGDHNDVDKSKPWEGSAHVPLMCMGPGIQKGQTVNIPVATMDSEWRTSTALPALSSRSCPLPHHLPAPLPVPACLPVRLPTHLPAYLRARVRACLLDLCACWLAL